MKPITDSELIVMSAAGNSARAPAIAMGMPAATQIATLKRRNSASSSSTSIRPV